MSTAPLRLYSIGHSSRSAADFERLLQQAGVACLIDVRSRPQSRRHPQFGREALRRQLAAVHIEYCWEGRDLGGLRAGGAADAEHSALREAGFRAFATHMDSAAFRAAAARLLAAAARGPVAFMCAEARPEACHRQFIADYLHHRGAEILHLLGPGERRVHTLRPALRLSGQRFVYDRPADGQLGLPL